MRTCAATESAAPTWLVSERIVVACAIDSGAMALSPTTVTGIMAMPTPRPCTASEPEIHPTDVVGEMKALPAAPIIINTQPVTAGRQRTHPIDEAATDRHADRGHERRRRENHPDLQRAVPAEIAPAARV